jgi:hypothetical protein
MNGGDIFLIVLLYTGAFAVFGYATWLNMRKGR